TLGLLKNEAGGRRTVYVGKNIPHVPDVTHFTFRPGVRMAKRSKVSARRRSVLGGTIAFLMDVEPVVPGGKPGHLSPNVQAIFLFFKRRAALGGTPAGGSQLRLGPKPVFRFVPARHGQRHSRYKGKNSQRPP